MAGGGRQELDGPLGAAARVERGEERLRDVEEREAPPGGAHQLLGAAAHLGDRGGEQPLGMLPGEEVFLLRGEQLGRVEREHRLAAPHRLPLEAHGERLDPAGDLRLHPVEAALVDRHPAHRPHGAGESLLADLGGVHPGEPQPLSGERHRGVRRQLAGPQIAWHLTVRLVRRQLGWHLVLAGHEVHPAERAAAGGVGDDLRVHRAGPGCGGEGRAGCGDELHVALRADPRSGGSDRRVHRAGVDGAVRNLSRLSVCMTGVVDGRRRLSLHRTQHEVHVADRTGPRAVGDVGRVHRTVVGASRLAAAAGGGEQHEGGEQDEEGKGNTLRSHGRSPAPVAGRVGSSRSAARAARRVSRSATRPARRTRRSSQRRALSITGEKSPRVAR